MVCEGIIWWQAENMSHSISRRIVLVCQTLLMFYVCKYFHHQSRLAKLGGRAVVPRNWRAALARTWTSLAFAGALLLSSVQPQGRHNASHMSPHMSTPCENFQFGPEHLMQVPKKTSLRQRMRIILNEISSSCPTRSDLSGSVSSLRYTGSSYYRILYVRTPPKEQMMSFSLTSCHNCCSPKLMYPFILSS